MNATEKIKSLAGKIPGEYDFTVGEAKDIKDSSESWLEGLTQSYMLGFYNGRESQPSKKYFIELESHLYELEKLQATLSYVVDGILCGSDAIDIKKFDASMYLITSQLGTNIKQLNKLLGYEND